jgi:hypothetical protein
VRPDEKEEEFVTAQDSVNESTDPPKHDASPLESPTELPAESPSGELSAEEEVPSAETASASESENRSDFGYDMYQGGDGESGKDGPEPEYDADEADGTKDGSESGLSSDSEGEHALAVPLQQLQSVMGAPLLPSQTAPTVEQEEADGEFDLHEGSSADSFDSPYPAGCSEEVVLDSSLDLSPVYPLPTISEEGKAGTGDQNLDENDGVSDGDSERTPVAPSMARRGLPFSRHPASRSPTSPTVADLIDHFSSPLLARSADRESRRLSRRKDSLYM